MIYTTLVGGILCISLVLYVILGGADFGAGIIELLVGNKSKNTVSRAIAPVWEANHIWLIIAVVILFNGFPDIYYVLSTSLHIPIMLMLFGIILRGAAFTFRHYDAIKDKSEDIYSWLFRYSSIFTVFFLGLIAGTLVSGTIPSNLESSFYENYILPWFNPFSISTGVFFTILSSYIANIFLLGEVRSVEGYQSLATLFNYLFYCSFISGLAVFGSAYYMKLSIFENFIHHPISLALLVLATAIIPFIFNLIKTRKFWLLRVVGGSQIFIILLGLFIVCWPNIVFFDDNTTLNIYNACAPVKSMKILFISLSIGIIIIFPSLYYLFRLFKRNVSIN